MKESEGKNHSLNELLTTHWVGVASTDCFILSKKMSGATAFGCWPSPCQLSVSDEWDSTVSWVILHSRFFHCSKHSTPQQWFVTWGGSSLAPVTRDPTPRCPVRAELTCSCQRKMQVLESFVHLTHTVKTTINAAGNKMWWLQVLCDV